jgi:hypothetical protein
MLVSVRLPHFLPTQALLSLLPPIISLNELANLTTESWQVFIHTKLTTLCLPVPPYHYHRRLAPNFMLNPT